MGLVIGKESQEGTLGGVGREGNVGIGSNPDTKWEHSFIQQSGLAFLDNLGVCLLNRLQSELEPGRMAIRVWP